MALGPTQPVIEMSTMDISLMGWGGGGGWAKGGPCIGLTILPPSCASCLEPENLNLLEHYGSVQACMRIALPLKNQRTSELNIPYFQHHLYLCI
jgi:hypothetical protein